MDPEVTDSAAFVVFTLSLLELIKNAYDSHSEFIDFHIFKYPPDVLADYGKVEVTASDNGEGFGDHWDEMPYVWHRRNKHKIDSAKKEVREEKGYFGGHGVGLCQTDETLLQFEGELAFRNKSPEDGAGAIITMRANINPSLTARAVKRAFNTTRLDDENSDEDNDDEDGCVDKRERQQLGTFFAHRKNNTQDLTAILDIVDPNRNDPPPAAAPPSSAPSLDEADTFNLDMLFMR